MKVWGKIISVLIITFLGSLTYCTSTVWAGPDQYQGDTEIYTGASTHIMPNVLLIVDNSKSTLNRASGAVYDPTHDYSKDGCASAPGGCYDTLSVYQASQQGTYSRSLVDNPTGTLNTSTTSGSLPNIKCTNNHNVITNTLLTAGTYAASATDLYPNLNQKGGCITTGLAASYALGNFLNYTLTPVLGVLVIGADGKDYQLIASNVSTFDDQPPLGPSWQTYWVSNGTTGQATIPWTVNTAYDLGTNTQQKIIYDAIRTVVNGARFAVRFGAMVYGDNNHGGDVVYPVNDLSSDAAFSSFLSRLPGGTPGTAPLASEAVRPLAETLYDSWDYFQGLGLYFSHQGALPSPVQHYCDRNYVIMITNGLPNAEQGPLLFDRVGDYDNDGVETSNPLSYVYSGGTHFADDVADMMYEGGFSFTDSNTGTIELMRIKTSTVLAFQADDPLMQRTGDSSHGRGGYYHASNANQLAADLNRILTNIVLESDTSFVAPVVPVSPENRVYSGNRVYMGFFKPQTGQYWNGNLKKYALDALNNIIDVSSQYATYVDTNGDGKDDRDGAILPQGSANGSFRNSAQSIWSTAEDGGSVTKGGAGGVLQNRDFTTNCSSCALTGTVRKIYTYLGTNTDLTASSNAFTVANTAITASKLGLPSTLIPTATAADVGNLINFISGIDAYDENGDGNTTEKRQWIFGDILHSKPLVINYQSYVQTPANEIDPTKNKTLIFVGSNDGVLHAINDYDGSEAWAFVPPDLLPNLQYLHGSVHSYFIDATVTAYIYDANQNGSIDPGDKVILILGERRGGGVDTAPTSGVYYALDVTDPQQPVFLWSISNKTVWQGTTKTSSTLYAKLGETWSEPKIGKIKIGTNDKIVAFIGGGYDNCNEDGRYGATQYFTTSCVGSYYTPDSGLVTSLTNTVTGGVQLQPTGTGIYVVEVATLDSTGAPVFNTSGQQIWAYTQANNSTMSYSILSEIAALDTNFDGYIDRLYAGDTGGRLWRFNIMDTSPSNWTATMIFRSNPGYTNGTADGTTGRKIFYKPSAVIEWGSIRLYFGTGDREHPLNTAVIDRLYSVVDNGQTSAVNESRLVDVTDDVLQSGTSAQVTSILNALNSSSNYGFYIRLNQNTGEKVLAPATVFSKVAYFTTYAPNTAPVADVCQVGNLGTSRIYAVDYKTGAAVINYDLLNDVLYNNYVSNSYATPIQGQLLLRSDRVQKLGIGIPSGIVLVLSQSGDPIALVGCGGGICPTHPKPGGVVIPLYWREK
jgi:type IV pilus assembly protein PilY1